MVQEFLLNWVKYIFDDYWMYFVDEQSSKEKGIPRPYKNLKVIGNIKKEALKP